VAQDKSKKLETYCIQAVLKLMVTVEISAPDLDTALAKSKEFKEEDFVTILGDYMEGNMKITGVYAARTDLD
jgi:hypothetical protein